MSDDIAIIGIAGKFPMAGSVEEFWNNLMNKRECITRENSPKEKFIKAKGIMPSVEQGVGEFFGLSEEECKYADPQLLVLLQTAYEALEDSGYNFNSDSNVTGVYISTGSSFNWRRQIMDNGEFDYSKRQKLAYITEENYYSTQISYRLNLTGPSLCIMNSCASSLVCVHQAGQALLLEECNVALAGGVYIDVTDGNGYYYDPDYLYSSDGVCKTFSSETDGTVPGNGAGMVVLKLYDEAVASGDRIYGVIKGSAVNNDGSKKLRYVAPTIEGISGAVKSAMEIGGIEAKDINFIETHGTGTKLGDLVEVEALKECFGQNVSSNCCLGTLKPNIGYLEAASGIAGFIKAVLAVYHKLLPADINIAKVNDELELDTSPFVIRTENTVFSEQTVTGGVIAYADGGTNICIFIQSVEQKENKLREEKYHLVTVSAKREESLEKYLDKLCDVLGASEIDLDNLEYTLNMCRNHYSYGCCIIYKDKADIINKLKQREVVYRYKARFSNKDIIRIEHIDQKTIDEQYMTLQSVSDEWLEGREIDWEDFYTEGEYSKISLPTYAF